MLKMRVDIRNSFQRKNGDTVILCKSDQTRDTLKASIENVVPEVQVKSPDKCRQTIAVVGLDDNYEGEELLQSLVEQNYYLNAFASTSEISQHLRFVDTKPLRNDSERFQAVFRISKELRQILHRHNDRLIVGVISCRVYNRLFVKRCSICQRYGHFMAQCQHKEDPCCAFCGGDHETKTCSKDTGKKCINCVRNGSDNVAHAAFFHGCPLFNTIE